MSERLQVRQICFDCNAKKVSLCFWALLPDKEETEHPKVSYHCVLTKKSMLLL